MSKKRKRGLVCENKDEKADTVTSSSTLPCISKSFNFDQHIANAWEYYNNKLGKPKYILSPMVGQSELAFRMLCRKHGCQLCYTPMLLSDLILTSKEYRKKIFKTCKKDRPLIVQICGNNPNIMLQAAKKFEKYCDGIDINLGCPQKVAERGNYGAFLMENIKLVVTIIKTLKTGLSIPISCKIRRYNSYEETLSYAKQIESAGCSLLCIHPRQRHEREEVVSDWSFIKRLKQDLLIPIIANGDMWHYKDVLLCEKQTSADAYMSAQGLLHNPALFEPLLIKQDHQLKNHIHNSNSCKRRKYGPSLYNTISLSLDVSNKDMEIFTYTKDDVLRQFQLAKEYLAYSKKYPVAHPSVIRRHIFFILFDQFQVNVDCYDKLVSATQYQEYISIISILFDRTTNDQTYTDKKERTRRRDGTIAPPKWPNGGGQKGIVFNK